MTNKRLVRLLAVAAVGTLALSSCGRSDTGADTHNTGGPTEMSDGAASGTITVWGMGAEGELLPEFVKDFEAENPGVKVEVTAIPWDAAHDKLQTAIAGGTGPDVAQMGTTWMTDFSDAFQEVPSNLDTSDMFEGSVDTATINGKKVGVPWYVDTKVLYYRTDLAEQAGWDKAPETWEELHAMASDFKNKLGIDYPIRMPGAEFDSFQGSLWMLWSAGGNLMNEDQTEWTIDTAEAATAYDYLASFYEDGLANPNADISGGANTAEFVAGDSPILLEGPYMMSQFGELGGADFDSQYTTAPLPKEVSGTSFVGGSNMVVFNASKNSDAAWKFVEWMNRPETQVKWFEHAGGLPSTKTAWDDPALSGNDKLVAFGKQLEDTRSVPTVPTWTQVAKEGDGMIEQIARGAVDPSTGLTDLQQKADSIGVE